MPGAPDAKTELDASQGLSSAVKGCRWIIVAFNLLVLPMVSVLLYIGRIAAVRLEEEVNATPPVFSAWILKVSPLAPLVVFVFVVIGVVLVNRFLSAWPAFVFECIVGALAALCGIATLVAVVLLWSATLQQVSQI